MHRRIIFFLTFFAPAFTVHSPAQPRLLDDFETLSGWTTMVSDGKQLTLSSAPGKTGNCLVMEFDLRGGSGYVIAEKDFSLDMPPDYVFTFDMRADAPVNNFEFKLMDDEENVFWIKKLNVEYPKEWARQRIKKRHLSFAWGPARQDFIKTVREIQFVVSVGTGGTGKVFIDNFRFESIDNKAGKNARATVSVSSNAGPGSPEIDHAGNRLSGWRSSGTGERESLTVDFHRLREVGGLIIDWDSSDHATAYDVLLSDDGKEWWDAYSVSKGNGGRDYIYIHEGEGRLLRLHLLKSSHSQGFGIRRMEVKGAEFSNSPNDFFHALAADAPPGYFPQYFLDRQSYWTVIGANGDTKEALMNEQGQIELDKLRFSLEPFLHLDGKLITWNDVTTTPALLDDYLPIPSVTWNYGDLLTLTVQAVAAGAAGNSVLGVRYVLEAKNALTREKRGVTDQKRDLIADESDSTQEKRDLIHKKRDSGNVEGVLSDAKLFIAIRPMQVNPPWQFLNTQGGVAKVDSISYRDGVVHVDEKQVISLASPSAFGAAEFDQGDITEYISRGVVPPNVQTLDHLRFASAALQYDVTLRAGQKKEVIVLVPFHDGSQKAIANFKKESPERTYDSMLNQTAQQWRTRLDRLRIDLPELARDIALTLKSNLAYIFINRDGPGIQPGSRSYERSWIRDGSLTCAALLRTGNMEEVRQFIDWYAKGQFPSGKIPCVMDSRGPDAVPEHDSHGQFIYAVYQYFMFSKDTTWLRGKFDPVVKAVRYIQSLRAERKTDVYKNGTPAQRALYGLVPESISHEGYSDVPRHSYWDDFFIMRGLKDAAAIAGVLGEKELQREFAAERDDFRKDFYASVRLAMKNTKVDYIPGCAELGDFDATSTTVGVTPGGELGLIPEPALHNTFDKYYRFFSDRKAKYQFDNYTPYETRVIGTFVHLGQKKRAEDALRFFMNDRRPLAWNHWAEVVWRDPATPKFIGDMPHTWVGSDFIRSVLSMFVLERERDAAHVLAAGIPDAWVEDSAGVRIAGLMTYFGSLNYTLRTSGRSEKSVVAEITGSFDTARHKLVMASPLSAKVRAARVNGKRVPVPESGEVLLLTLPAKVEFVY